MKKEEILQKHCDESNTYLTELVIDGSVDDVYAAMDEYAKEKLLQALQPCMDHFFDMKVGQKSIASWVEMWWEENK
jgi:hypothetical protein